MIRVERQAGDFTISTEVPEDADRFAVALALRRLDRFAPLVADGCPGCRSPYGVLHEPSCPLGPGDLIARACAGGIEP